MSQFNPSTICATLAGSILQPSRPFGTRQPSVLMVPLPCSFLVVDVWPGEEFDGAIAGALQLFPVGVAHNFYGTLSAHPRSGRRRQWPECGNSDVGSPVVKVWATILKTLACVWRTRQEKSPLPVLESDGLSLLRKFAVCRCSCQHLFLRCTLLSAACSSLAAFPSRAWSRLSRHKSSSLSWACRGRI